MKTLDDQVPSGYFDALPNKTLARLEGKDMQSTTGTTNEHEPEAPPPTGVKEDSGLHDIRSLAQSTKQRMANKRTTNSPVRTDDELLAASSAGWVALPEPAKMVSLPSIDELPSKKELRDEVKASKAASTAADVASIDRPAFGANLTARKKSSKAPVAIAGVVLAAAAGVGIYVFTQNQNKDSATAVAKAETTQGAVAAAPTPPPAPVVEPKPTETPPPPPAPEPAADTAAAGSAAPEQAVEVAKAEPAPKGGNAKHVATKSKPAGKMSKTAAPEENAPPPQKTETKPVDEPKKPEGKKGGKGDENEPSFDALLKEAGVDQTKKPDKPKLEKKELSRSDFNAGMGAVKNAAQACYKGTQGTAMFKMTVAPSGQVTSVSVTGAFAGKPEASCVESAVKSAHFPAWDGSPQTFTYSYLLAD